MGYSFGPRGLACDNCHRAEGDTQKVRCTYKWCQSPAFCKLCRENRAVMAAFRQRCRTNCKPAAKASREREQREQALLNAGQYVRRSALNVGPGDRVQVLFRDRDRKTIGRFMSSTTYRGLPLLQPATPDDYAALGTVEPAPADFVQVTAA